nr:hypothetical protein [Tanacetum cinerariifolium]
MLHLFKQRHLLSGRLVRCQFPSSPIVSSPIASPATTPATTISVDEDLFLKVGAQLEFYASILHDHTQHLEALSPTLFEGYDRDLRELYTRSEAVRDEIFLQRYRFRSLEREQERATMTFNDEGHGLDDEGHGLDDEGHGLEDKGPGSKEEETTHEGQQQAVLVVDTVASEPLGLGYVALRCRELALGEGSMPMKPKLVETSKIYLEDIKQIMVFAERLSEKDIGGLKQMFKMIDADNNGTIRVIRYGFYFVVKKIKRDDIALLTRSSEAYRANNDSKMKKVNRRPRKLVDLSTVRRSSRVRDKPPQSSGKPSKCFSDSICIETRFLLKCKEGCFVRFKHDLPFKPRWGNDPGKLRATPDLLIRGEKQPVKRLSEKDIGGLKQMFKMIDADNNGTIKVIRLLAALAILKPERLKVDKAWSE